MIIIPHSYEESVIYKLKMRDEIKSYNEITEGDIVSLNSDPLQKKNEDISDSLMSASISSNQS